MSFVVSEYGGVEEITSSGGKQKALKQPTQQSPKLPTTVEQSFHEEEYAGHDAHAKELLPLPNPAASLVTEGTNQPQRYPHQVRALPGHMWYLPQMVPNRDETC